MARPVSRVTLKGFVGFENNFNDIYFHNHFYFKTGVSRNGLSLGYSEGDTSSVYRLWLKSNKTGVIRLTLKNNMGTFWMVGFPILTHHLLRFVHFNKDMC